MFGATMCPSSGVTTVFMQHLALVIMKEVDSLKLQGLCHKMKRVAYRQVIKSHLDVPVTVHHNKFRIIKPTRCTNFSNLFLE
jgi:hypothetical protein